MVVSNAKYGKNMPMKNLYHTFLQEVSAYDDDAFLASSGGHGVIEIPLMRELRYLNLDELEE